MIEVDTAIDRASVFRAAEEEAAAIEAGDLDQYANLLTPDATFMPPNVAPQSGESLRNWLGEFMRTTEVHFTHFEHGDTMISNDLACHAYFCSWTAGLRGSGQRARLCFKGMHVLRRLPDGSWKIAVNIWNTDPAPDAARS